MSKKMKNEQVGSGLVKTRKTDIEGPTDNAMQTAPMKQTDS